MRTQAQSFGQAGAHAPAGSATVDKWQLLDALTLAAPEFDIGHRQIAVLRAVISFHPQRHLPVTAEHLIVFPSNKTLCKRLGGMPESTLRRHLARLITSGLLGRRTSANGKRFRRGRGETQIAFGLDLAPFVQNVAKIQQAARQEQMQAEEQASARASVLALKRDLAETAGTQHHSFLEELSRAMRRKLTIAQLKEWLQKLTTVLSAVRRTKKMSASASENERHIDLEQRNKNTQEGQTLTLDEVDMLFPQRRCYFSEPLRSWEDVNLNASILAPMLGISPHKCSEAIRRRGASYCAIAVLYVLERIDTIDSPNAYFDQLLRLPDMLNRIVLAVRKRDLSADNQKNTILSVL